MGAASAIGAASFLKICGHSPAGYLAQVQESNPLAVSTMAEAEGGDEE